MHKETILDKAIPSAAHTKLFSIKNTAVMGKMVHFSKDTLGATAVEYGLLAGLVALGIAGGLGALSDLVNLLFENIGNETAQVTSSLNEG